MQKMQAIIKAQGKQTETFSPGRLTREVSAPNGGHVIAIDNFLMSKIARLAGAPMDKGAGVDLLKKLGDQVDKGEPLYRIHAEFPADFDFACAMAEENSGYLIGEQKNVTKPYLEI